MARQPLQIGRQSGAANSTAVSVERLLNGYLELTPEGKEPAPVYGIPGLTLFSLVGDSPIRGMIEMAEILYVVSGEALFRISSTGVATNLGSLPSGDMVDMATDGTNIVIVVPETGGIWVYNGTIVGQVTDPDAPSASSVDWVDGYFIFGERNSDIWAIAALSDPFDFDPLAFAAAEWRPDRLVRPLVSKRDVFLFGSRSIEAWRNTGVDPIFPFERLENVFIDVGLAGAFAAVYSNDAIFWLAEDKTVRRLDGVVATPIQTPAIARIIAGWGNLGATKATAHVFGDHLFVMFHNPEGCIVWDQRTERWHERTSWRRDTYRGRTYVEAYGRLLLGGDEDGKVYAIERSALTEDGERIPFEMIWPYVWAGGERFTTDELEVIFEVGTETEYQDVPPTAQVMLDYSDDGRTWGPRRDRSLGARGAYKQRLVWQRLGQARQRAYRIRIGDVCPRVVISAFAQMTVDS